MTDYINQDLQDEGWGDYSSNKKGNKTTYLIHFEPTRKGYLDHYKALLSEYRSKGKELNCVKVNGIQETGLLTLL